MVQDQIKLTPLHYLHTPNNQRSNKVPTVYTLHFLREKSEKMLKG